MSQAQKDIDRPLGQPKSGKKLTGGRVKFGPLNITLSLMALAVFAGSATIAFREKPFRSPPVAVVTTPEVAAVSTPVQPAPQVSAASRPDGPAIIRVNPDQNSGEGVVVIRDPSAVGQNPRVAHLPDKDLIEQTDAGPLPVRAMDGRRPFDVYARPWSGARGARITIVLGGLGLSQTGTQSAIEKLPPEITLAFAPQGNSIGRWMQAARQKGHEIVMQLPLEPFDYPNVTPGRNTLTVDGGTEENLKNLRWTLSRTTNYTGVMNYMGARFSTDAGAFGPVMAELGKRGLLYLDDGSSARSLAPALALENSVPFASGDNSIDAVRDRSAIMSKLDELERIARAKGFAIGTGSAFDMTVDAVVSWAAEARRRGIEIVPVSALAADPEKG
ncbi:divergent polysaccharide deacetylase family protein [Mesorhizobium sp. SB112]|uniref:divergent polysaccharide deacetylase family protein n=1 Tax=Mesorhizobium sp. SB112 TaxID=3151853 RepID=UPI00326484A3